MKRGATDLSEVVTALLSLSCPPSTLVFSFSVPSSLPCSELSFLFYLHLSSFCCFLPIPTLFSFFWPSPSLHSVNELSVCPIYFDNLFFITENCSIHTCSLHLSLSHTHTPTHVCSCVSIFTCHPHLMAHPSLHWANQGGRKSMVHSRTMAASMVQWSRLSVWGPCPTCSPSDPPTVTDSAAMPRQGLHYSVTSTCQAYSLMAASALIHHRSNRRDMNDLSEE